MNQLLLTYLAVAAVIALHGSKSQAQPAPDKSGVKASKISLPSGPGSIEGLGESFEPQLNTGTFSYGVKLQLPPGRAGLAPSLRLSYNSGSGNSFLGIGWSLDLPCIKRQTDKGFPSYSAGDTFIASGEELVPLSNPERDWRAENESAFSRYRQIDSNNDQVTDAWEMVEKNGTRHTFGTRRDSSGNWSAVEHPAPPAAANTPFHRTYLWALDSTEDLHGNRIEYHYLAPGSDGVSAGLLYPSRIRYSLHRDVDLGAWHEVRFRYENRPDVFDDYRATFGITTGRRLAGVDIYSHYDNSDHLVRSYAFEYAYRPEDQITVPAGALDTGLSQLKRVVQRDRSGNLNNYLPPLLFEYSTMNLSLSSLRGVRSLDLNGAEFSQPPALEIGDSTGNTQIADVDGDSLPDIIRTDNPGQKVTQNLGEKKDAGTGEDYVLFDAMRNAQTAGVVRMSGTDTETGDFDADGLTDILQFTGSGPTRALEIYGNLSTLDRVTPVPLGFSSVATRRITNAVGDASVLPQLGFGNVNMRQMDLNFDKISDWVRTAREGAVTRLYYYWYDPDTGWGQTSAAFPDAAYDDFVRFDSGTASNPYVKLADMNGDRLLDMVYLDLTNPGTSGQALKVMYWPYCNLGQWGARREMLLANGNRLPTGQVSVDDIFIQDVTGDGLSDILVLDGASTNARLILSANVAGRVLSASYTRTGLPRYAPRATTNPTTFRQADLNANGSTDLIWRNIGPGGSWQWLELLPQGKPNLLVRYDNGLGKVSEITYGNAIEDVVRGRKLAAPWTTKIPIAMQVVRRIRTTCGVDLDGIPDTPGQPTTDQYVTELAYRDAYYDALEREFRGFAFAQRIDYGDDFQWDPVTRSMVRSAGWDASKTPTGQVSGPTLVSRYRFLTGAPDRMDNDEYAADWTGARYQDEFSSVAGREEEILKGKQIWEEKVDPWALHDPSRAADFDAGAYRAVTSVNVAERRRTTPDAYVYTRARQGWVTRRLYRPSDPVAFLADQNGDGDYADPGESLNALPAPAGRQPVAVLTGNPRTVSFAFPTDNVTETYEANGVLSGALGWPVRSGIATLSRSGFDDYGNEITSENYGIVEDSNGDGQYLTAAERNVRNDERLTVTDYALQGDALTRWIVGLPARKTVTDENGAFVSRTRSYYDGPEFQGLPLYQVGARALAARTEGVVTGSGALPPITEQSELPGDPRLPAGTAVQQSRTLYDRFGNAIALLDPLANPGAIVVSLQGGFPTGITTAAGHARELSYDSSFRTHVTRETIFVGDGKEALVMKAGYDLGFGTLTSATDFNDNTTFYEYDSFARLVAIVKPYDSAAFPTQLFHYRPADPLRYRVYAYDRAGNLSVQSTPGTALTSRVITHFREQAEQAGVHVKITYSDGCGRTLLKIEEDETAGDWAVTEATSYNRRQKTGFKWQPYNVRTGGADLDAPQLAQLWPQGRPPQTWIDGTAVTKTDIRTNAAEQEIIRINPPETWELVGNESARTRINTQLLPFEKRNHDENDSDPASPHFNTPLVHISDGLGRLVEVHEVTKLDDNGFPVTDLRTWITRYNYDLNDKLIRIQDSQDNVKWFRHDGLGRKLFMNDPDRGVMFYTYDTGGNLVETVDAKSQRITYTYEGVNRLAAEDYHDEHTTFSARRSPDVAFYYDRAAGILDLGDTNSSTTANTKGFLSWVTDLSGEEHISYDRRGRVSWIVKRLPDPAHGVLRSYKTEQTYDSIDRVQQLVYPDNDSIYHTYNERGLLAQISGGSSASHNELPDIVSKQTYHPVAQLKAIQYGNSVLTAINFDPRFRMRELRASANRGTSTPITHYKYAFDNNHNISSAIDLRPSHMLQDGDNLRNTQLFTYDTASRLSKVTYSHSASAQEIIHNGEIQYSYDRIGNLVSQTSNVIQHDGTFSITNLGKCMYGGASDNPLAASGRTPHNFAGPHAIVSTTSGRTYAYDEAGNLTHTPDCILAWNYKGKVSSVQSSAIAAEYLYDYTGRRVVKRLTPYTDAASTDPTHTSTTLYVDKFYEVRPNGQQVKFVWNGKVRCAQITGFLHMEAPRVQRASLLPGWNLVNSDVFDTNGHGLTNSAITRGLYWNNHENQWQTLSQGSPILDGMTVWLDAKASAPLELSGSAAIATEQLAIPQGVSFAGQQASSLMFAKEPQALARIGVWQFRPKAQSWKLHWHSTLSYLEDRSQLLHDLPLLFHADQSTTVSLLPLSLRVQYFHHDHMDSTIATTSGDGNILSMTNYHPYGHVRSHRLFTDFDSLAVHPYGYSQKERDEESKLSYFEARYLDTVTGSFGSVDPLALSPPEVWLAVPQNLNTYRLALNSPSRYSDKSGMAPNDAVRNQSFGFIGSDMRTGRTVDSYFKENGLPLPSESLDINTPGKAAADGAIDQFKPDVADFAGEVSGLGGLVGILKVGNAASNAIKATMNPFHQTTARAALNERSRLVEARAQRYNDIDSLQAKLSKISSIQQKIRQDAKSGTGSDSAVDVLYNLGGEQAELETQLENAQADVRVWDQAISQLDQVLADKPKVDGNPVDIIQ